MGGASAASTHSGVTNPPQVFAFVMYICNDCISTRTEEGMMSVRRSAQIITAAVPLLLVGAAAPALALDQAPPAAVETAAA